VTQLMLPGATETGLSLPAGLSYEEWAQVGHVLGRMGRAVQWWLGDWLLYGEHVYGEKFAQAATETGFDEQTLMNAQRVARSLHNYRRRESLSFSHHEAVAALSPAEGDAWLDEAEQDGCSVHELRRRIRLAKNAMPVGGEGCTTADLDLLPEGHYGTIYADPPWLYGNQGTRAATGNHYGGLSIEELCALPVGKRAGPNAHLHLWTTNAFLFDARTVMEAWGFTYKSCFVWVKPQMGIGNYWRVSHEFMLFGLRGDAPFRDRGLMSWAEMDRGRHSAKPETVRAMIERASPGPYLELFGRRAVPGWDVWGNEVSRDLLTADMPEVA
jgi:N6-adenosine-specific RNA methylase IME4